MSKEKTLIFYKNWWVTLRKLDDATLMPLLRQLFDREFADGDGVADISTNTGMALAFIFDAIERDRTKYQAVCDKRAEAGKRHKGNQHSSASLVQMEQMEQAELIIIIIRRMRIRMRIRMRMIFFFSRLKIWRRCRPRKKKEKRF